LQRAIGHQLHALEGVIEVVGVRRLRGNLRGGDAEQGAVIGDDVLEGLELCVKRVVVLGDVI